MLNFLKKYILNFIFEAYMTNERKEFIDKYIKEIISTSYEHCSLCDVLDNGCKNCQLTDSIYCFNPWYVNIFTLQTTTGYYNECYNSNINEILTYISSTYPEIFV